MSDKPESVVVDRWKKGQDSLRRDTRQYWTNTSFFIGEQWVYWSTAEDGIRKMLPNAKRSRVTRNRIKRSVRVNLGKLLRNELVFDVSPNSADDAAVKGAQLGTTSLANTKDAQNWENLRSEVVLSAMLGGTAAVCVEWDPVGYKQHGTTPEKGRPFGEGDVCLTPMSIIEFVVEPGVKDGELAKWWIKATAEDPHETQEKYGLEKTPEPDATTALGAFEQRIIGAAASESGAARSYEGRVMVRTMYERPSRQRPQGRVMTIVNDKVVQDVKWPFKVTDRLNLFVFRDMKVDGRWTGESMVTDAVPIQEEVNLSRSVIMEHLKKTGNARLFVPDETIDEEQLTDEAGSVVFYSPTSGKPEWSSPPPLPQWEVNYPEQAAAEIDDILGVHDISRGEAPKGVEAGTALALLAERDDTPLSVFARDQAEGWGRIGTFVLKCYEQFITTPRKVTVKGEGVPGGTAPRPYSVEFTGDMLHGQTKAKVPIESTLPTSRAVQQARADSMLQMGAFGTPPDMRLYVRVADLPDKSQLLAALSADADKAQRSCEAMFRGQAVVPREFDNHGIAIAEANAQRKSERYEQAPPDIQELFDNFVKAHEVMAAEEVGRQEMQAAESPNLAAAPQADEAIGSGVPPAQSDLGAGGQPPLPLQPGPSPQEIAAMVPPPVEPAAEPGGQ